MEKNNIDLQFMNIATAANERYFGAVITMLNSLLLTQKGYTIRIFFLYCDISDSSLNNLQCLAHNYGAKLILLKINLENYVHFPTDNYSIETCFRLELPYLLPDLDKILYLDADLIIKKPIDKLYEIDMGQAYLAAGNHFTIHGKLYKNFMELWEYDFPPQYFNAGVLMMNLKQLRRNISFKDYEDFFLTYYNRLTLPDEFLLNLMFYNKTIKFESQKYNYGFWNEQQHDSEDVCIIHYVNCKPWLGEYKKEFDEFLRIWWKYVPQIGNTAYQVSILANEKINILKQENTMLYQWKKKKGIGHYFTNKGIRTVAIYGVGRYGELLCDELLAEGIIVSYLIDKAGKRDYKGIAVKEVYDELKPVDLIILAAGKHNRQLALKLKECGIYYPSALLEDIVQDLPIDIGENI